MYITILQDRILLCVVLCEYDPNLANRAVLPTLGSFKPFRRTANRAIESIGQCLSSQLMKLERDTLVNWINSHKALFQYELGR